MACDDEVIPSQERIETLTDDADLEDVYNTERQRLYVACTRARDHLLVTSGGIPSEFWTTCGCEHPVFRERLTLFPHIVSRRDSGMAPTAGVVYCLHDVLGLMEVRGNVCGRLQRCEEAAQAQV
jgi:hypothetical protein